VPVEDIRAFQLFDSSLPIGTFQHSATIEEACYNVSDIEGYIESLYRNVVLKGDVVAAKASFSDPYCADTLLYSSKLTNELRNMITTTGGSLAALELGRQNQFIEDVKNKKTPGTYPVVISVLCKDLQVSETLSLYGIAYSELSMMVLSAVRMRRINFLRGQKLIAHLLEQFCVPKDFLPFHPLADILSRRHEVREPKVFLS
jgi:urease accessory protein